MTRPSHIIVLTGIALALSSFANGRTPKNDADPNVCADLASDTRNTELVRDSINTIRDPHHTLDPFFAKLKHLHGAEDSTDGPIRTVSILHLGDSHIQGGYMTGSARQELQRRFGNAGRGLIVPLKLARTNEPTGYRINSPDIWNSARCTQAHPAHTPGIGGIALSALSCPVSFQILTPKEDPFCCVTVFHHPKAPMLEPQHDLDPGTYCPQSNTDTRTVIPLAHDTDSLVLTSYCPLDETGNATIDSLYNTPIFYGFMLENGRSGLLYHSSGINGAMFGHYNASSELIRQTAELAPDLIVVSLGTNDALGARFNPDLFYNQVDSLISALRNANPETPLLLTTPMEIGQRKRSKGRTFWTICPGITRVRDILLRVAKEKHVAVWDLYAISGGSGANARWREAGYVRADRTHLTVEGYELQGRLFAEAILRRYRATTNRK